MSDAKQRVRLVVEYDMEIFDGDPDDVYVLAREELQYILDNGFDNTLPDPENLRVSLTPIFEAGS